MRLPLADYEITMNDDPTLETISLSLFVQGCIRRCDGCQNPELQKFDNSYDMDIETVKEIIKEKSILCQSVVFEGGDFLPIFEKQLAILIEYCKNLKLRTILYTGEKYEDINKFFKKEIDIIISDPYDKNKSTDYFPASSNQRVWINGKKVEPKVLAINNRKD